MVLLLKLRSISSLSLHLGGDFLDAFIHIDEKNGVGAVSEALQSNTLYRRSAAATSTLEPIKPETGSFRALSIPEDNPASITWGGQACVQATWLNKFTFSFR